MVPTVLILAGGVGKRFVPFRVNKTLFPFFGTALLGHTLAQLERCGFRNVLVTVNEDNEEYVRSYQSKNLSITVRRQEQADGMAQAVLLFADEISGSPLLIMNAIDQIDDQLFTSLLAATKSAPAVLTGIRFQSYFPGGYYQIKDNRVISVIEKPGEGNTPSDLVRLVYDYFSRPQDFIRCIREILAKPDIEHYEIALDMFLKSHEAVFLPYEGYWQAVKYPFHILDMMELFLKHRLSPFQSPTAEIADSAHIEGAVYIGEHVRIMPHASVKGPVYLGDGVIIGDGSLVRESVIEAGSVVGFASEVSRSYVGPQSMLHHNFVGDSILESQVNPSWGTCFANTRFDKAEVKIKDQSGSFIGTGRTKFGAIVGANAFLGINTSVLPGRMIGPEKHTHPGTIVEKNLLD